MPSLLSAAEQLSYTGDLYDHFLTFQRQIVVVKEPLQSFTTINTNVMPGYNNYSNETNNTFTPVSGIYSGMIVNRNSPKNNYIEEIRTSDTKSQYYIKVESPCRDYIMQGKTEKIIVNEMTFNVALDYRTRDYLGLKFYQFDLTRTY